MSKHKPPNKKKVVVTAKPTSDLTARKRTATPSNKRRSAAAAEPLTFGRDTYIWMGIGVGLIFLGMILMAGGHMPSRDVWDPEIIYGFRRTVLAPFLILAGLGMQIFAIFKK